MNKKEILEQVKALFDKNTDVNKAYVTSDGNVFRAAHYADNWKQTLAVKAVTEYTRADISGTAATDAPNTDGGNDDDTGSNVDTGEKEKEAATIKKYIELFDTKPNAVMSIAAIEKAIAEKEAGTKPAPETNADPAKAERAALVKEYVELIGKQPVGQSVEKIKAKIAELKAK